MRPNLQRQLFALLITMWNRFGEWNNFPVLYYEHQDWHGAKSLKPKIEIRRIDLILLLMGVSIAVYFLVFYGWQIAVLGTLFYVMVLMMAFWMF